MDVLEQQKTTKRPIPVSQELGSEATEGNRTSPGSSPIIILNVLDRRLMDDKVFLYFFRTLESQVLSFSSSSGTPAVKVPH